MTFDPSRRLVMATFRTVLGHGLNAGTPLTIVDEPSARGEVDEKLAQRLYAGRIATYAEDFRPTPVETPEMAKRRQAVEAVREAPKGEITMDDLEVWQEDDEETGKKKGQKVTKDDLLTIARRESVEIETDDNKADLIRKITINRAGPAGGISTNSESDQAANTASGGSSAATTALGGGSAHTGPDGDAHGVGGEGEGDEGTRD